MNSRTAAEETTIAALVFMDIGFDLLWKRNYSLRANPDIISALMPDYCALLRAKMTFSNRRAGFGLTPASPSASIHSKGLTSYLPYTGLVYISPGSKGENNAISSGIDLCGYGCPHFRVGSTGASAVGRMEAAV
jgi:hypothetical protein